MDSIRPISLWRGFVFLGLASMAGAVGARAAELRIQSSGAGRIEITWMEESPGFALETTTSLLPPTVWEAVDSSPTVAGLQRTVTLAPLETERFYRLRQAGLTTIIQTSPTSGESSVSVARETVVQFSGPLAPDTQIGADQFYAEFGGRHLLGRVELADDRRQATLFYLEPLPAGSRVQVGLECDSLLDVQGQAVDGDGDSQPGGTLQFSFDTMTSAAVPRTAVFGRVLASDPVSTGNGVTNRPLTGVIVTVDGAEERLRATTDETGFFSLSPSPAGRFFVHIDGRSAVGSDWPTGDYYPFVGKTFEAVAGTTNNRAGGTGEIFLPLVKTGTLQTVSPTQPTTIHFPAQVLAERPDLAGVSITVPANALHAESGTRGGKVGIAPVAPDRIPSPLPAGLDFPIVITIQTDGPQNFAQPVPVRFPNLPDRTTGKALTPGAKSALWSYNHDTGLWEIMGSMTVSADGQYVETDPGVGVLQAGWHSSTPGSTGGGGGAGKGPCSSQQQAVEDTFLNCMLGTFIELLELSPGLGCVVSLASAASSIIPECLDPTKSCVGSLAYNGLFGAAGCVPGVGTYAGMLQCGINMNAALGDLKACQAAHPARTALQLATAAPNSDPPVELQESLLSSWRALFVAIYGDPVWLEAAAADPTNIVIFGNALVAALDPASQAGARISAAERDALLAMNAPAGVPPSATTVLLDRFHRFASGGMAPAEQASIRESAAALTGAAAAAESAGWTTPMDGIKAGLVGITDSYDSGLRQAAGNGSEAGLRALASPSARTRGVGIGGYGPIRSRELLYRLTDLSTGFSRRGRTSPNGQLDQLVTAVEREYLQTYLDPESLEVGTVLFRSGTTGDRYTLPMATLTTVTGTDSDQDGLIDLVEDIVGTRKDLADSDGDGDSDFSEVRRGQNPLDGLAMPQGVVASLYLGGSPIGFSDTARALGLVVDGSRVFVANGKRGLAVVDAANPLQPKWEGELDLTGESFDISYACGQKMAALLASPERYIPGERGLLHFVDVTDPRVPRLIQTYSLPGVAIDHWNGSFFVALGQYALREVRVYEAGSALETDRFTTQDYPTGLRVLHGYAYVATLSGLEIHDLRSGTPRRLGQLSGDFSAETLGRVHLALDGTTLYVGKTRGVTTIDVSNPEAPVFLATPPADAGAVRSIALTGGPRLLALVSGTPMGNPSSPSSLSVLDASSPTNTSTLLFGLGTPGRVRDVALLQGFAAVADDQAGLTILNVGEADQARRAPTVSFDFARLDIDPTSPGIQIRESHTIEIAPRVMDDIQLDRAELWINGALADSTRDFPVTLTIPNTNVRSVASFNTNLVVQIRAMDRSGNEGRSNPTTLQILPDREPPGFAFSLPSEDQTAFVGQPIVIQFTEPVDNYPIDSSRLKLLHLGADSALGGNDDTLVPVTSWSLHESTLLLNFVGAQPGRYQLAIEPGAAFDRVGNSLARSLLLGFDLLDAHPGSAVWIADNDGAWEDTTNWLHGRLPSQDDDVVVSRRGGKPKVALASSAIIKSLRVSSPLIANSRAALTVLRDLVATDRVDLPGGSVTAVGAAVFEQSLVIQGGQMEVSARLECRGLLSLSQGASLTFAGPSTRFLPSGGLQGTNFSIAARDGAVIAIPGFTDYVGPGDFAPFFPVGTTFSATGAGSRLTLSQMTTAAGPLDWSVRGAPALHFEARNGGVVELPAATSLTARVRLLATGDSSLIDAPRLATLLGSEAPFPAGIEASYNGRIQVPLLTTIENCPILITDGGVVVQPGF